MGTLISKRGVKKKSMWILVWVRERTTFTFWCKCCDVFKSGLPSLWWCRNSSRCSGAVSWQQFWGVEVAHGHMVITFGKNQLMNKTLRWDGESVVVSGICADMSRSGCSGKDGWIEETTHVPSSVLFLAFLMRTQIAGLQHAFFGSSCRFRERWERCRQNVPNADTSPQSHEGFLHVFWCGPFRAKLCMLWFWHNHYSIKRGSARGCRCVNCLLPRACLQPTNPCHPVFPRFPMGTIDFPMVFINHSSRHLIHRAYFKSESSMVWLSFCGPQRLGCFVLQGCFRLILLAFVGIMLASRHELIWTFQEDFRYIRSTPRPLQTNQTRVDMFLLVCACSWISTIYLDWLLVPTRSGNTKKMGQGVPRPHCAAAEWYSTCDFAIMRQRYSSTEKWRR